MTWNILNPYGVHRNKVILKKISEFHGRILDIGCGTFNNTIKLCKNNNEITAVDMDKEQIDKNKVKFKHLTQVEFKVADALNLPFERNYFDDLVGAIFRVSFVGLLFQKFVFSVGCRQCFGFAFCSGGDAAWIFVWFGGDNFCSSRPHCRFRGMGDYGVSN